MQYFKGIRQNGEVIYISIDASYRVESSNGFVRDKVEKRLRKSGNSISDYIRLIFNLREKPEVSTIENFINEYNKIKKIVYSEKIFLEKQTIQVGSASPASTQIKTGVEVIDEIKSYIVDLEEAIKNQKQEFEKTISEKNRLIEQLSAILIHYMDKDEKREQRTIDNTNELIISQRRDIEDFRKKYNMIAAKNQITDTRLEEYAKVNGELQRQRDDALEKLKNIQRWLAERGLINTLNRGRGIRDNNVSEGGTLGSKLDGSSGFHERRELGRFGSLPSFDNYSDDYNEKDDSQREEY